MFVTILLTGGCGSGEEAIDNAADAPNSFPEAKNPNDDFQSGTTGDSNNAVGLAANEVRITVEVPHGVAPEGELTRRNLRIIRPDSVEVYRTNQSLQPLGSVNVSRRTDDSGREVIAFNDGRPIGPDVIIEVVVGNTRIRSLAADDDRDLKVNPYSEFLVTKVLGGYTQTEFNQVMDCVNSTDGSLCLNKYVWATLADQVHDFEIDIPDNYSLSQALQLLEGRADFTGYVTAMADYALLGNDSSGFVSASSVDFNSIWTGFELGQTFAESSLAGSGQWGVRTGQEKRLEDTNGVAWVYPGLTLTSLDVFGISVTSLASDTPYNRETLIHTRDDQFYSRGSETWDLNSHASAPGAATLANDTRLLAGRALYQSVTGRGSSRIIGWTRNPYPLDAWVGGDPSSPDRLTSVHFSAGKAIELRSENGELKREQLLEDHFLSALEIHLARQLDFDAGTLSGRNYNLVTFTTRLGNENTPVVVEAGIGTWQVTGQVVIQDLATMTVARDSSGAVITGSGTRSGERLMSPRPSILNSGTRDTGRLSLDLDAVTSNTSKPQIGTGASSPDGTLLAFNLDNFTTGDGLLVAGEQTTTVPVAGHYRLQGVSLGLDDTSNQLSHFDQSVLTINSASQATLRLNGFDVVHRIADDEVVPPADIAETTILLNYSHLGSGRVLLTGSGIELEGFVTPDQQQWLMNVRQLDGAQKALGLVIATPLPE
ncbi:MAG: hypothetical protein EP339_08455 [Gammaproteobacteria bacterium]|nr:MAG: hypothetical protein EP339_08455 [Gammaproteobacteria bacterium]